MAASMKEERELCFRKSRQSHLISALHGQRLSNVFCDVLLHISDATVTAHSCVLAIFSPYFNSIFTSSKSEPNERAILKYFVNMSSKNRTCKDQHTFEHVEMKPNIPQCVDCVNKIIDYFYLGTIKVTREHLQHLEVYGKLFGVAEVTAFAEKQKNIDLGGDYEHFNRPKSSAKSDASDTDNDMMIDNDDEDEISDSGGPVMPILPYVCSTCNADFDNANQLDHHKRSHVGKCYICLNCGSSHQKVADLLTHLNDKTDPLHSSRICSLCLHKFYTTSGLRKHLTKHNHPKPFFCSVCDLRFTTRTTLSLHVPKHSTETPYSCKECGRGFKWKHSLQNHMVVHSLEKKHLCDQCGFSTAYKSTFQAHKLVHSGDTFKCSHPNCDFSASRKQNLKMHILTHSKQRPYQCEVCGQSFSLHKNMRRHARKHNSLLFLSCPRQDCKFHTSRMDKYKEHLKKVHVDSAAPKRVKKVTRRPARRRTESKQVVPPVMNVAASAAGPDIILYTFDPAALQAGNSVVLSVVQ